jgi:hypothetical protein
MPAPARRPSRRPLVTRRAVASGSVLGVGLLIAGAPAALADDSTPGTDPGAQQVQPDVQQPTVQPPLQDVPDPVMVGDGVELGGDFGTGKFFDVYLDPTGDYPADLDLSGATFTLTGDAGQAYSCTTVVSGDCEFMSANFFGNLPFSPVGQLPFASVAGDPADPNGDALPVPSQPVPDGTYTLSRTGAVTGLDPVLGTLGTVTLSGHVSNWATDGDIPDASLFRTAVDTTVVDSVTGAPVAGATYGLSGPDYPHAAGVVGTALDAGPATSTSTGALTWGSGWFLPGTWTFTPSGTPTGYRPDAGWTTTITTTADQAADPWTAPAHPLVAVTGGAPSTAPVSHPAAPAPSVAPAAPTSRAPITHPSAPPAVQVAAAPTTAEPAPTTEAVPATEPADPSTASPDPVHQAEPKLQTESRTLPESGLIGIGILFVAVVFFLVLVVRRRARRG